MKRFYIISILALACFIIILMNFKFFFFLGLILGVSYIVLNDKNKQKVKNAILKIKEKYYE